MKEADALLAVSRALRFSKMNLRVDGDDFNLKEYPFLIDLIDEVGSGEENERIVVRKGGQMGFTASMVFCAIDLATNLYHRGILYLMPTRDDVYDFSRSRFDRMMKENEALRNNVGGADSMGLRKVGNTFLYFRGAKSRSQLKSIPVDMLIEDEADEMEPRQRALAEKRLDGSKFKHRVEFSTPTLPEYGVDLAYGRSDQRMWHIKCTHCGAWTCLEDEWPKSLERHNNGDVHRACKKCRKEVYVIDGQWVPAFKDRDWRGFYVSQLCSPRVLPRTILDEYEDPMVDQQEFYNHRLGLAYALLEDALTEPLLAQVVGDYPAALSAQGPCIMGADVGKEKIHVMVGEKVSDTFIKMHMYRTIATFDELHDIGQRFNVDCAVIDEMAETRKVREFTSAHGYAYGNWYSEAQRTGYDWKDNERRVAVNRTELLDHSHKYVLQRMVSFPRRDGSWDDFVKQMTNLARKRFKDVDDTGKETTRWVVRGGRKYDHFRHAFAYLILAAERAGVSKATRKVLGSSYEDPSLSFMGA